MTSEEKVKNLLTELIEMIDNGSQRDLDKADEIGTSIIKLFEQEQKTGHWIDVDGDNAICGCCNRLNHFYGTYCKHCGAKMVEPQESEDKCKKCEYHRNPDYTRCHECKAESEEQT